jgi:hypothetical protein
VRSIDDVRFYKMRGKLAREMLTKSLDVGHGTGLRDPIAETGNETTTCDRDAMSRDTAGAMAVTKRQGLMQHVLDVDDEDGG